ncbi:MAG: GNAT family N-acetyltransferase [Clostridiales bacterium]|nr:GNAT family N-acetyltransferase [Clostridiales bacterium]
MQITYERGAMKDIKDICELFAEAKREMNRQKIFQWDDIYPDYSVFEADIKNQTLYVGRLGSKIAVVYVINMEADIQYKNGDWEYNGESYWVLHRLCIHPQYQNCGLGGTTLKYIHEQAKKMKINAIHLDVYSKNPFALSMYKKAGYNNVGTAEFRKGRFYLMEKLLKE